MPYKTQVTLTSKGQMTLPAELRKQWDLKPGDKLQVALQSDGTATMAPSKKRHFLDYVRAQPRLRRGRPLRKTDINDAIYAAVNERYGRGLRKKP